MKAIGWQQREFFVIYNEVCIMVCFIRAILMFHSLVTQILIGQVIVLIDGQLQDIYFNLVRVRFPGPAKKLRALSLSSYEAEYRAAKEAAKEAIWI